jgi:drug/metabolite transporter (DMT)-like permease
MRKDRLDSTGIGALLAVSLLLALNQIIVKYVNHGLQPVFFAGLRSALAVVFVGAWLWYRGLLGRVQTADLGAGLLIGAVFAVEFLALFVALDLTTVGRSALIMYSMPVWLGLAGHFFLPGERSTPLKAAGLGLAFAGTAWAILSKNSSGVPSLAGDLCALVAAWCWAGTAFVARKSRLRLAGPEAQLFWMVLVSAPILLAASLFFGPLIREVTVWHWIGLVFQASVVVAGGFVTWLWLLSVYPASTVASFSFLTPILAIFLGHVIYGEVVSPSLIGAGCLVSVGIVLINRRG